ncbi:hypothetical protein AXF42_Ash021677 [Apostasia shenzhenica]|uniref:N-acetyltransferase domain-containing protein n=1 Tax=Apostasia shenzhenica TaxID=1088818 RepID=A0A2H9ZSU5_9ASPA|nr:hypothetical protein AXF42_Ash021677 [Apostasia shenzhenica]
MAERGAAGVIAELKAGGFSDLVEVVIEELDPRRCTELVKEIARLEKKIFPKHESLARFLEKEVRRKNSGLIYAKAVKGRQGGDQIVGYVMYSLTTTLCASITKLAGLSLRAVKENYRRLGHGEALLKAAIQKCRTRNVQRVCLHVDPERIPALSLYRKLSFQIDELVESYYCADRNAYRMSLKFEC